MVSSWALKMARYLAASLVEMKASNSVLKKVDYSVQTKALESEYHLVLH